jgi:hypothetical protein
MKVVPLLHLSSLKKKPWIAVIACSAQCLLQASVLTVLNCSPLPPHLQAPMEDILPPSGLIEWSTQGLTIPSKPDHIFSEHPWICADRTKNHWAVGEGWGGGVGGG